MESFTAKNLTIHVGDRKIAENISFEIRPSEIHALIGPNGSGKSSLAYAIFGHPEYSIASGSLELGSENLLLLSSEERARRGLFLSFQEPPEIGGISVRTFLRSIGEGVKDAEEAAQALKLDAVFLGRFLNEGFSGGEKKKTEILQFLSRRPRFAFFDEIDTGLDVDSVIGIASIIRKAKDSGTGIFAITHSPKFLSLLSPDTVHLLSEGKLSIVGGKEIVPVFEEHGYRAFANVSHT